MVALKNGKNAHVNTWQFLFQIFKFTFVGRQVIKLAHPNSYLLIKSLQNWQGIVFL
jgi:hypothetical protein